MSKKYVPSFLKEQSNTVVPNSTTSSSTNQTTRVFNSNKFAVLSDDFPMNKPSVKTSSPATLASLTSNNVAPIISNNDSNKTSKKSFANKFAEQLKIKQDPNYIPPPKPINLKSEDDFPSLGGTKNVVKGVWGNKSKQESSESFAEKAKEWANKKAQEEEEARIKAINEERRKLQAELMKSMPVIGFYPRSKYTDDNYYYEEEEYSNSYEESSEDINSYETSEDDEEPLENDEDNNDGEFNTNTVWDGRRKDDLY